MLSTVFFFDSENIMTTLKTRVTNIKDKMKQRTEAFFEKNGDGILTFLENNIVMIIAFFILVLGVSLIIFGGGGVSTAAGVFLMIWANNIEQAQRNK